MAELAELVGRLSAEPDAASLVKRARAIAGRLHPEDPARWAMREQTVTVEVDVPARVVVETLANEGTGAVMVMASGGPVGIVAERDVVAAVADGVDLDQVTAADLINADLVSIGADETVAGAANLMVKHHVRHLPIVRNGRVNGLVSALDLLRATAGDSP